MAIRADWPAPRFLLQIALLLLDSASAQASIQLPKLDLTLAPGTPVVAVGFGTTSEGSAGLSGEAGAAGCPA